MLYFCKNLEIYKSRYRCNHIIDQTHIFQVVSDKQQMQNPGRQFAIFSFFFNLSQWLVLTFEIQKFRSSLIQSDFYGLMPWIIIQRTTLPLAVFFRFHSSVISIELWKGVYARNEESDQNNDSD